MFPDAPGVSVSQDGYTFIGEDQLISSELSIHKSPSRKEGFEGDDGYVEEYDYHEPYFEPANEEEALIQQLNALAVTEIPGGELE